MTHTETVTETTHTATEVRAAAFTGPLGGTHRGYRLDPPLNGGIEYVAVVSVAELQSPVSVFPIYGHGDLTKRGTLATAPHDSSDAEALGQLGYRIAKSIRRVSPPEPTLQT
jgi:hypothetical protein